MSKERPQPHSQDAERSVLGSILVNNEAYYEAAAALTDADFYSGAHQILFRTIANLIEAGKVADFVTVQAALVQGNLIEKIGGFVYIAELTDGVPALSAIQHHIDIIRQKALLRRIYKAAEQTAVAVRAESDPADTILDEAQQRLFVLAENRINSDFVSAVDLELEIHRTYERLYCDRSSVTGIPTGFRDFDNYTSGLQPSELIIIAARPSMGKTALCLNIARNVALEQDKAVAIFSLEMSQSQLMQRLICSDSRVDGQGVRSGWIDNKSFRKMIASLNRLKRARLYIDESAALTVAAMRAKCRRLKAEKGLDLVIVDYLQLMSARAENRTQEVSMISRGLKALAKDLAVPVVALSQLSRQTEQRGGEKRPQLSDLRESGSIEQDADVVGFIYREEVYKPAEDNAGTAELIIAKQRNGPIGTARLAFLKGITRFESLAPIRQQQENV